MVFVSLIFEKSLKLLFVITHTKIRIIPAALHLIYSTKNVHTIIVFYFVLFNSLLLSGSVALCLEARIYLFRGRYGMGVGAKFVHGLGPLVIWV